ncbi:MAG: TetR/AcrR family transcriptional regulator [Candidatus Dormibacteraeota bacterium]|nr:TetR/AcrR family transcriptional regulator [Candidatus Dormibacteraeota bacterium]
MPKLWTETIQAHRREVSDAILEAAAALVARHGLHSVTMSEIAGETGIGRATLYKYFPDVETILVAWHHRHVAEHLERLVQIRDEVADAGRRLEAVLEAYAQLIFERPRGTDLAALVHRGEHLDEPQRQLQAFFGDLLAEAAGAGEVRDDVASGELAGYCLHALGAAAALSSRAEVRRLVTVTLAGLRPPARVGAVREKTRISS